MPFTQFDIPEKYRYRNGFNSYHESEAIQGTLPVGQNSPQKVNYGLYTEKLSGTAFTAPRWENKQTWLYRILPASAHTTFQPLTAESRRDASPPPPSEPLQQVPNQIRWDPFDLDAAADWTTGLHHLSGAGDPTLKQGLGIYIYSCGRDMPEKTAFYSADGDFLIVPQHGALDIQTELGNLLVRPNEICCIPRGIRYRVTLPAGPARGYVLELYEGHFQLPELGPIGSSSLAEPRDFQIPLAAFTHDVDSTHTLISKFANRYFTASQSHSPFDIVAWHGTYYPWKYDLGRFATIGALSHDHPDPSIFTVLTAPSARPGTAAVDFAIFPPRWLVAEHTFRPPWYHRNVMAEFMGLICGAYDAKKDGEGGFQPGGASLHNVMSGHGPDAATHKVASEVELKPQKVGVGSMAFMFESCYMLGVTEWGLERCRKVQEDYSGGSWGGLEAKFRFEEGMVRIGSLVDEGSR